MMDKILLVICTDGEPKFDWCRTLAEKLGQQFGSPWHRLCGRAVFQKIQFLTS